MQSPEEHPASRPPLIVILGPTAVGKTEIAILLAERLKGEIVSADSRQFYRGMDIGTAKPNAEQRARVVHHLIDIADPDQTLSLGVFQRVAHQAIQGIHARGHLPFLVGGTGQYIEAITSAWQIPRVEPHPDLRRALENWGKEIGTGGLYERLRRLDPEAADQIDPRNLRRTVRALEVILRSGHKFSDQRKPGQPAYRLLKIGLTLPRPQLYARIDARIEAMINAGLLEEVQALLDKGYRPDLPAFSAIGYRELIAFLRGEITLQEAVAVMKRRTRQFVRHQANWFKTRDTDIIWFQVEEKIEDEIEAFIRNWLQSR